MKRMVFILMKRRGWHYEDRLRLPTILVHIMRCLKCGAAQEYKGKQEIQCNTCNSCLAIKVA